MIITQKTPKMTSNKRCPLRLHPEKFLLEYTHYRATLIFVHHDSRTSGMSGYSACFTVCHVYLIYGSILSYLFTSKKKKKKTLCTPSNTQQPIVTYSTLYVKWWNSQHSQLFWLLTLLNGIYSVYMYMHQRRILLFI